MRYLLVCPLCSYNCTRECISTQQLHTAQLCRNILSEIIIVQKWQKHRQNEKKTLITRTSTSFLSLVAPVALSHASSTERYITMVLHRLRLLIFCVNNTKWMNAVKTSNTKPDFNNKGMAIIKIQLSCQVTQDSRTFLLIKCFLRLYRKLVSLFPRFFWEMRFTRKCRNLVVIVRVFEKFKPVDNVLLQH